MNLLFIDEASLTSSLEHAGFKKMGVDISTSKSYAEAQKHAGRKRIDVLIINLDSQRQNILDLVRKLKNDPILQTKPLVITGVQIPIQISNALVGLKVDLIVEQPIPREVFIEKLKAILEQSVRQDPRVSAEPFGKATFTYKKKKYTFPICDISLNGMLVQFRDKESDDRKVSIPVGEIIDFKVYLPATHPHLIISGEVVRYVEMGKKKKAKDPDGIGIRFIKFSKDAKTQLKSFMGSTHGNEKQMQYYL